MNVYLRLIERLEHYGMNTSTIPQCAIEIEAILKCGRCGKHQAEICGSCVSDIAQETGDQAYNSR